MVEGLFVYHCRMEHSALNFPFFWVALYILTLTLVRSVQLFFLYLLLYYIILLLSPVANPQFDYTLKPDYFHKNLRVDVHSHHIVLFLLASFYLL